MHRYRDVMCAQVQRCNVHTGTRDITDVSRGRRDVMLAQLGTKNNFAIANRLEVMMLWGGTCAVVCEVQINV